MTIHASGALAKVWFVLPLLFSGLSSVFIVRPVLKVQTSG